MTRGHTFQSHSASAIPPRVGLALIGSRPVGAGSDRGPHDTSALASKIHSLANLAAVRATCRVAAAARRSQARRGTQPTQDAGRGVGIIIWLPQRETHHAETGGRRTIYTRSQTFVAASWIPMFRQEAACYVLASVAHASF